MTHREKQIIKKTAGALFGGLVFLSALFWCAVVLFFVLALLLVIL